MNPAPPTRDYLDAVARHVNDARLKLLNPVERYLNGVASLPPAPMLVTELLKLFREPDRDINQVVQLLSYEPSLTAQIFRTCNSAYFAGEQPPEDIFEAVSRLGFYQVYCLVVSSFGAQARSMEGAAKGVNVEELWRHSVAVAVSASVVAEEAGQSRAVAFTAGLLHDIGKLVLASVEREPYARLCQRAKEQDAALSDMERSVLGIDHAELGGELMRRWNLPPDVVAAVRHHHDFDVTPAHRQLTASVQVGDMIAHQLFAQDLANAGSLASPDDALAALHLKPDDLDGVLAKTQAELEKVKGLLEM